jgi:hypothetical protein
MPEPIQQDIDNAAARQRIADRQLAEYSEAVALTLAALGPGCAPWMKLVLIDADHRRTGNTEPVATVYKVYRGEDRLSENSVFLRRMPDGTIRKADRYEPLFGELLEEKHPTRTVEVRGQQVPVGRWELCWQALELYRPQTAEALAKGRETRERNKTAREEAEHRASNPLFTTWAERNTGEREAGSQRGYS